MALNLKDLIAKAESKGIKPKEVSPAPTPFLKPWQEESVLFRNANTPNKTLSVEEKNNLKENTETKQVKIDQNLAINQQKTVNKLETNSKQSVNKLETNSKQSVNKSVNKLRAENENRKQSVITTVNTTVNKLETNSKQSVNKTVNNFDFSSLVGLQRSVLIMIYESCKNNRSKFSQPLTLEHLASHLNTSTKSIKTTIQRLVKKGNLERVESKNGRGGWTKYTIQNSLHQSMLQNETVNKLETNSKQSVSTTVNTTVNKPSSSSSIYNNITTTTKLPDDWLKVDPSPLEHIGFSVDHLMQLYKMGEFTPQSIQDSIEYFSFDLLNNNKTNEIKTNPLAYFMGILKRSGVYTAPENYESSRDRAMRLYLEQQRETKKKREAMENEILEIAFSEWEGKLTEEGRAEILPEELKRMNAKSPKIACLRQYFRENLWGKERENRLMELNEL